jgi:hypothetical protein
MFLRRFEERRLLERCLGWSMAEVVIATSGGVGRLLVILSDDP